MLQRKRQDRDSSLSYIILILWIVRAVIVKYYYFLFFTNTSRKIICTNFSFFLFSFLPFFADRCETAPARHPLCRTSTLFWLSFGTNTRSAPRPWQGRHVDEQRPWMPEILILILLFLIIIIIIIIFAINKQCNHSFCTQQHCWYHMAYILYYWIRVFSHSLVSSFAHLYFEI